MDIHLLSYYVGIFIVFASHLYMLFSKSSDITMKQHSYINLFAATMIAYYFMHKEKYIEF